MTTSSTSPNSDNWPRPVKFCIWLAVAFVLAGFGLLVFDLVQTKKSTDWGNPGIRGDFFGGHLAAVSGLAGTLLFFAALLLQVRELGFQRKQLALQLDEFKQSREVAEQQATALEEQTSELKAQNDNLRRQVGLTESRDETQLIMSIASDVQRLEDTIQDSTNITGLRNNVLEVRQKRSIRFAARRIVLRFELDQLNAQDNTLIFFARLPERLHTLGFKSLEAAAYQCTPTPGEDSAHSPVYLWIQNMKLLITEEFL